MKYYMIAGERSGDLHGGNLLKALKPLDNSAHFRGFGGDYMQAEGLDLVVHYNQMAFMGLAALITNAKTIYDRIRFCKADILTYRPDVVVLIDYGGFNRRIAKFCKVNGILVFYYISPKVWAWYTSRAWELKRNVDRMFVILPFEKQFFKQFDFEVDYVGNPVLDSVKAFVPDRDFRKKNDFAENKKIVALLPGSRKMELKRMIPVMAEVVRMNPQFQFVVAAIETLPQELYEPLRTISFVKFVYNSTYDLLKIADAAIVTSGTATLETGLFNVPQVVIYKGGKLEIAIIRTLVKVPFISLINLIANKPVIKELIQHDAHFDAIDAELKKLLSDGQYRTKMIQQYESIYRTLDIGSASENAASLIISYLSKRTDLK
jgi:lipid-A-disaccharide synthase